MTLYPPRSGYTLPVFACAAAVAALRCLRQHQFLAAVEIDLITPAQKVEIPIEQVAKLQDGMALAITRSDPGDNLDLTRNTPIWALLEWGKTEQTESIVLLGGEGIGRQVNAEGKAAIYSYAEQLFQENLSCWIEAGEKIQVTIILPEGRSLATRTSNAAFGVVEGLSLLGTTGISQPLSAPGQLEICLEEVRHKAAMFSKAEEADKKACVPLSSPLPPLPSLFSPPALVFCVGENGIDLAQRMGIKPDLIVKTANWLGSVLVEAGLQKVPAILLFGYHGKLIKLAGGIFHTHHHLADGRLEIFTAYAAQVGLPTAMLQKILACATAEDALKYLREVDSSTGSDWVNLVYRAIAYQIDQRSQAYIRTHSEQTVQVGSVLFDRDRQIIFTSTTGDFLLSQLC
ncbi:cobalt-precorrin-6A synthase (deacetylating) [Crinalium epipsammum PCC 9333]|uniref:Cobalt-precorrin-5B C(1)-methyltransferase n=1 Tax=Crinalium epipsammum PCC 9333 TaxID=1173022 RepID=K9W2V1_9CYAN|nr:cobalt-precorrin-5B (C(1))-methyltransferase [Crinalium epipsammum]AFZ13760.1 cobalt-precorrin-6A synthase (deacetylating) [Crinalium epipsammum PCC 9333]